MRRITLVLMISLLSIFVSAAVVIADGKDGKRFSGVYEMIARGNALISTTGFTKTDNGWIANAGGQVWGTIDMAYGTWIFERDGTGTVEGKNFAFDLPPGNPVHGVRARDNDVYMEFEYYVSSGGAISISVTYPNEPPPGNDLTMLDMEGMVSQDRKTITLHSEYVEFNDNVIFMASRVLIRVKKKAKDED